MDTVPVAKVAVSAAKYAIDKPYDYRIPKELRDTAVAGVRVIVPFSVGNRRSEGVILAVSEAADTEKLKKLDKVLDAEPVLTEEQIRLAVWLRERCFCTVYDALRVMLPAGLWFKTEYCYTAEPGADREEAACTVWDFTDGPAVVGLLFDAERPLTPETLEKASPEAAEIVETLVSRGYVRREAFDSRKVGDKTLDTVCLAVSPEEAREAAAKKRSRSPQRAAVLEFLLNGASPELSEVCYFTGASPSMIRAMAKTGLVRIEKREVFRRPERGSAPRIAVGTLSPEQQEAFEGLAGLLDKTPSAALLYGVTGSGKTAVYLRLIREVLDRGRGAIVLVPEIALTPQLVGTFEHSFGDSVAVLHSSLGVGERLDEWKRIRSGAVGVVVGTRSAVFAPLNNLGLIVIDEEQEHTYKSENCPAYHARDVAKYRCAHSGALLLLGSATPAVESMYSARQGRYSLFRLSGRFNMRALPEVLIADMKSELRNGNGSVISSVLRGELEKNIASGEQSILFINRRGASSFMVCPECGFVHECPRCSVSLTYHSVNRRLMCHYCGYSQTLTEECPKCGGLMKYVGAGTQKVADELREQFPGVKVLRMDADTVTKKNTHDTILARFEQQRIPILVGTQMVAKGLNFDNVTLAGVVSADQSLYSGDWRAHERTFSLITQVVGRSGRGQKTGRAVIQTFTPDNEVIKLASRQDYDGFYEREIPLRRLLGCPPIADLFVLTASGKDESEVLHCCADIRKALSAAVGDTHVLGPAPASVVKVNNRYRYRVTVTGENARPLRGLIAGVLKRITQDKQHRGVAVFADINPMD